MRALVTGGAKRLGAAIATTLAKLGFSVVVHFHHSRREAEQIVAQCRSFGVEADLMQGDLSSPDLVVAFAGRYLDSYADTTLLVNNVGNYIVDTLSQTSMEQWITLFNLNLHLPFILTQALLPSLILHKGHVINIGVSGLLTQKAHTYASGYMLTKQGLWEMTRAYARELAPKGIKMNMISPGQLDISVDLDKGPQPPIGFPSTCDEICRVVEFLLHPANKTITGQNIEIAGGLGL